MTRICREVEETIEEEVEKEIEEWVEKEEEKCKEYPWYDPRGWVCWIVTTLVKVVKTVVVTVTKVVTRVVCEVVSFVLNVAAVIVSGLLAIPLVGRLASQLLNVVTWVVGIAVGAVAEAIDPDSTLTMRLCVIVLQRQDGGPVIKPGDLEPALVETNDLYSREANVEVEYEPVHWAEGNLASAPQATSVSCSAFGEDILAGWADDLGGAGGIYELLSSRYCFESSFARLSGIASPLVVFVVEDVEGAQGCSLGPLTDYVVIEGDAIVADDDRFALAHEIGHACGLVHHSDTDNLMHNPNAGPNLTETQADNVRRSPYATRL
jgi:hypothetical protein